MVASFLKEDMLSVEEERRLILARGTDSWPAARDRLIVTHGRLAHKMARVWAKKTVPSLYDEFRSACHLGLVQAADRVQIGERKARFATYACWWMRSAIDEVLRAHWTSMKGLYSAKVHYAMPRLVEWRRRQGLYRRNLLGPSELAVATVWIQQNITETTDGNKALGPAAGVTEKHVALADLIYCRWIESSLDAPVSVKVRASSNYDVTPSPEPNPEEVFVTSQSRVERLAALRRAMMSLTDRERAILTERRLKEDPPTLEELGRDLGITKERVRQIEHRVVEKLQSMVKGHAGQEALCTA
jgi:RNA polymerase sigma-32 factor